MFWKEVHKHQHTHGETRNDQSVGVSGVNISNNVIHGPKIEHNEHTARAIEALAGAAAENAKAIAEISRALRGPAITEYTGLKIDGGQR